MDEEECSAITALRRGEVDALRILVTRHQTDAIRLAALILGDRTAAEDAVADAFLRVWDTAGRFDPSRPFRPWFRKLVVREALRVIRSRRQWGAMPEESADPWPSPEEQAERVELRAQVATAVQTLSPTLRSAVVLRFYGGLKEKEIAVALHCALGTVKWRLSEAKRQLRGALARGGLEVGGRGHR